MSEGRGSEMITTGRYTYIHVGELDRLGQLTAFVRRKGTSSVSRKPEHAAAAAVHAKRPSLVLLGFPNTCTLLLWRERGRVS